MNKYILLDCNYIAHMARFSVGALDNGVIFGFFRHIINLAETYQNNKFLFTWDSRKSFRKKYFPAYKEKRHSDLTKEEREELYACYDQMHLLRKEILPALGFNNNYYQNGCEGDDLMAELVLADERTFDDFIMVASDKDLYQLLRDGVSMLKQKGMYTVDDFQDEWRVTPAQWRQVKSIGGCSTDEVPGMNTKGEIKINQSEKTLCKYLKSELKETTKAFQAYSSKEAKDISEFNKPLVELPHTKTKPLKIVNDKLRPRKFKKIFEQYEFNSFLTERWDEWERFFKGYKRFRK